MDEHYKLPDISNLSVNDPVLCADKQAEILQHIDYFQKQEQDADYRRNLIALSFIHNSVDQPLYDSIIARLTMPNEIEAIESQLGPLDSSKISTLSLFFSLPHLHDQITSALNTRLAANPKLTVNMEDILDIAQQLQGRSTPIHNEGSIHLSKINTPTITKSSPPISSRSEEWKNRWLTLQNPCFYCREAGHWMPECQSRKKATSARITSQQKEKVAGIGAVPALEYDEALLDSGATHSVVGDASLYCTLEG
ncbi:hypothetical protein O181_073782 [Austropuccinia psidii MF-1]|uniref:CCHC-type domain-containing protein n=1 Tax=Austropuccinia psidii MF-1 TaxID=1389203 RepID=A0A9Q3F9Q9_9BASI|nr:hypothetical protein [Austropuccinia psidii MF-1]